MKNKGKSNKTKTKFQIECKMKAGQPILKTIGSTLTSTNDARFNSDSPPVAGGAVPGILTSSRLLEGVALPDIDGRELRHCKRNATEVKNKLHNFSEILTTIIDIISVILN